jgi:protein subunit release factor A
MVMNQKDLKTEYFKSGGPGGQHKNKRNMSVRITHLPTGLVAVGQESRSQIQNKELALSRLEAKLRERFKVKKARIKTRISRAKKEKVLDWKRKQSRKKQARREKFGEE